MTTWIIGKNCEIKLQHPDVNSGDEYGFLLNKDGSIKEQGVQFKRQVVSDPVNYNVATTLMWFYFDVLCGPVASNPDGTKRAITRMTDYIMLMDFLSKTKDIQLTTTVGTFVDVGSLGWSVDERHLHDHSIIKCNLNNIGYYFPPVDPDILQLSVWDGTLTWATSYWR